MGDRIRVLPLVHGSADFALAVRDVMLEHRYDCVAVPLPPTFQEDVEAAVDRLPEVAAVCQVADDAGERCTYVPIDPCQGVIRALRIAKQERIRRAFIDLEIRDFRSEVSRYPDPYALKQLDPAQFAAAVLPATPAPEPESQRDLQARHMAHQLHRLELEHERILFLPSVMDWPWIRDAWLRRLPYPEERVEFSPIRTWPVDKDTLTFFLAELPWITNLYEEKRKRLTYEDRSLSIDGIKELLLEARDRVVRRRPSMQRRLSLTTMKLYLQYVRNLTLVSGYLRPDLATLVEAAKQVFGDEYAIELVETAKEYPSQPPATGSVIRMSPGRADLPEIGVHEMESRLPGSSVHWRSIELKRQPDEPDRERWSMTWNPHTQCSWPPEDSRIENFNLHVREQAKQLISNDLARVEKFSTSMKDGLDIRETLRNWHTGDLYVREMPPARGNVEVVVFLFDVPADAERYTWRTTWFAEHENESTLCFFATDFGEELIGPGVAQARYGGAFFLYPPRPIIDVWQDPAFRDTHTLEERLLAGAFAHSSERHVAIVAPCPLKATWRRLARRFGKQPILLPLSRFSTQTVDRLRTFHVLNGKEVRSYASEFIRRPE